uniref:hypothetical protein n=1 Tax=Amycolatopsis sp. CA-151526 TaxID=3239921 RepID=UPI003F497FE1
MWPAAATLCGRCWLQFGGKPDAADAGAAPRAALEVRSVEPLEWSKLIDVQPWRGELRRDCRSRVDALVSTLARHAHWSSGETWPTWAKLMETTGWRRSSVAAWLRQLWILGWIDRVEPGSTPATRPMGSGIEGNRAAVYGLLIPVYADAAEEAALRREYRTTLAQLTSAIAELKRRGAKTWTPTGSLDPVELRLEVGYLRTRAREIFHRLSCGSEGQTQKMSPLRGPGFEESDARAWTRKVPTTRAEMYSAAAELRGQHPTLSRMSVRAIRSTCRSWWQAGWCNDGVLHALRCRPTGWTGTTTARSHAVYGVIHPAGWVRSRLSIWTSDQGKPLPDPVRAKERSGGMAELLDEIREQDRAAYGRTGAALLRQVGGAGAGGIQEREGRIGRQLLNALVSAVTERGRAAAEDLAATARADRGRAHARASWAAHVEARATARAASRASELTPLQQQLRDQAAAAQAARGIDTRSSTGYRPRRIRRQYR